MAIGPLNKIRVGVLRGGPSSEYEVSLKTGAHVLRNLPDTYHPQDIFISKTGAWHMDGLERTPEKILSHVDVIFNALHGEFGEDGKVQYILESFGKPYTGSGISASALGMNKLLSKKAFASTGIKTPYYYVLQENEATPENILYVFKNFPMPAIIKPLSGGSSVGMSIARDLLTLEQAVRHAFTHSNSVLVEEFINGKEASCSVIEGYRGFQHYTPLPVEIVHDMTFFDYYAKYSGASAHRCPGNFTRAESDMLQKLAVQAHKAVNARHYSHSDFIISPNRGVYILEINTLPGLTPHSLFPKSLEPVGATFSEFLDHVITLALGGR